jgi:hypothetical protein
MVSGFLYFYVSSLSIQMIELISLLLKYLVSEPHIIVVEKGMQGHSVG